MADCDLCGVSIPTVCSIRVFSPEFERTYPEGVWKGLCCPCLEIAKETFDQKESGKIGKCNLCGMNTLLRDVHIQLPSFSKDSETATRKICMECLEVINEAFEKKDIMCEEQH